jgi:hypothetical protein
MATTGPLVEYHRVGFALTVYPNRIEVVETGVAWLKKHTTVLLRNVASVEMNRVKSHLTLKTNDGKKHSWVCGLRTEEVYQAILAAL